MHRSAIAFMPVVIQPSHIPTSSGGTYFVINVVHPVYKEAGFDPPPSDIFQTSDRSDICCPLSSTRKFSMRRSRCRSYLTFLGPGDNANNLSKPILYVLLWPF